MTLKTQTTAEENIKLKFFLKIALAEIKKREDDLKPLNFKIGEFESYVDELKYNINELKNNDIEFKKKLEEDEKNDSFYKKRNRKLLKHLKRVELSKVSYITALKKRNAKIKELNISIYEKDVVKSFVIEFDHNYENKSGTDTYLKCKDIPAAINDFIKHCPDCTITSVK